MHPDQRLLEALLEKRAGAESEFIERYRRLTVGLAMRRFALSRGEADEIFQDLVVVLWKDDFRALRAWRAKGRLSTYLASIVTRLCLRRAGARRAEVAIDAEHEGVGENPDTVVEAETEILELERAHAVRRAMARLEPHHRLVLQLLYQHEVSPAEIAGLLSLRRGTARKRLHDARVQLRKLLRRHDAELFTHET